MKTFKTFSEAFTKPYKWEWVKQNSDHYMADFYTDSDSARVIVNFHQDDKDESWEVTFNRDADMGITGEGDAFSIFATVMDVTKNFIKKAKPFELSLEALKQDRNRSRLYERMLKKFAPKNYSLHKNTMGRSVTFTLTDLNAIPDLEEGKLLDKLKADAKTGKDAGEPFKRNN